VSDIPIVRPDPEVDIIFQAELSVGADVVIENVMLLSLPCLLMWKLLANHPVTEFCH